MKWHYFVKLFRMEWIEKSSQCWTLKMVRERICILLFWINWVIPVLYHQWSTSAEAKSSWILHSWCVTCIVLSAEQKKQLFSGQGFDTFYTRFIVINTILVTRGIWNSDWMVYKINTYNKKIPFLWNSMIWSVNYVNEKPDYLSSLWWRSIFFNKGYSLHMLTFTNLKHWKAICL